MFSNNIYYSTFGTMTFLFRNLTRIFIFINLSLLSWAHFLTSSLSHASYSKIILHIACLCRGSRVEASTLDPGAQTIFVGTFVTSNDVCLQRYPTRHHFRARPFSWQKKNCLMGRRLNTKSSETANNKIATLTMLSLKRSRRRSHGPGVVSTQRQLADITNELPASGYNTGATLSEFSQSPRLTQSTYDNDGFLLFLVAKNKNRLLIFTTSVPSLRRQYQHTCWLNGSIIVPSGDETYRWSQKYTRCIFHFCYLFEKEAALSVQVHPRTRTWLFIKPFSNKCSTKWVYTRTLRWRDLQIKLKV